MRADTRHKPVIVTNHGRDDLVLLSVREFNRLKSRDRQALRTDELSAYELDLISESAIAPEAGSFDHEIRD